MTYDDEYIVTHACPEEIKQDFQKWLVIATVWFLHAQGEVPRNDGLSPIPSTRGRTGV